MNNSNIFKKYVFLGDTDSINIEIIAKSHNYLKKKIQYVVIGNKKELKEYLIKIKLDIKVNEITDPISFKNYKKTCINIYFSNNSWRA